MSKYDLSKTPAYFGMSPEEIRSEQALSAREDARDAQLDELYDQFFRNTDFRTEIKRGDLEQAIDDEDYAKIGRTLQWMWELEKDG